MARKIGLGSNTPVSHKEFWFRNIQQGEKLLWEGTPNRGLRVTKKGVGMSLAGILVLAIGYYQITWSSGLYNSDLSNVSIAVEDLLIGIVGGYLLFGHFIVDIIKRKFTRYALSDRKAYISTILKFSTPDSYVIKPNSEISFVEGPPDSVFFYSEIRTHMDGRQKYLAGFRHIDDGQPVFDILMRVKSGKYTGSDQ